MKWMLLALVLFPIIIFIKLKVYIKYFHGQDNDHLEVKFKALFGIIRYKLTIPLIKIDDNSPTLVVDEKLEQGNKQKNIMQNKRQLASDDLLKSFNDSKEILNHVIGLHRIIRKFLKKVVVKDIEWHSVIGIGDAAHTGLITGAIWAVKGSIVGIISNYMQLKEVPTVTITPNFQFVVSQTSFKCMIQFRIGHAMFAGIKLLKFWKGGKPRFKTKPLSMLSDNKTKSV